SEPSKALQPALDSELRPLKHLVAEPCCERLAQSRVSAIANPGDVSIGTHQYGGRCTDLAEYWKCPGAGIRGIDELNSVGPRCDVEATSVTEVEQHRLGVVQQREHSHGAVRSRQIQVRHAAPQQRMSLTEVIRNVEARDHGG